MKIFIALCLFGLALAAPQSRDLQEEPYQILRSEIDPVLGAVFRYLYETENGIFAEKRGYEGSKGQSNMDGSFSFTLDDGTPAEFTYVADENGYQVQSNLLPVAPPMPQHAIDQIASAASQRAQGIDWDQQGFVI